METLFAEIFKNHEHTIYMLALRLTKSDEQAKDIVQDVFLKLWEQQQNIPTILNTEAWLYRVTENKVIDLLRKAAADDRLKENAWNNIQQNLNETEAIVATREYSLIIQKAIDRLPPQRKLVYLLNQEKGLNYQEIADELQISRHTVKNHLHTALQSIRSFFSKTTRFFLFLKFF